MTPELLQFRALLSERTRHMTHSQFLDSLSPTEARKYLEVLDVWLGGNNPNATAEDYYWHSQLVGLFDRNSEREEYDLRRASELNPSNVDVWVSLGHLARSRRQFENAIAYYERGIQALPTNFFPWYGRAGAFMEMGRFAEALHDVNHAISIHPTLAYGYELRAVVYEKMGDLEHAFEDANTAVEGNACRDWTYKLQRRIGRKYAQRGRNQGEHEGIASLDIIGWAIRVAAWDSLLPIFVLAAPFLAARLAPNNRDLSELVGVGVPIIACIIRAIVGIRHIQSNGCSADVRKIQYCVFCVALLFLALIDTLLILTDQIRQAPPTLADCLVLSVVMSIYLPCIAFAMYPGKARRVA
jgi:tetratricopeptide (TPR) repeat protein